MNLFNQLLNVYGFLSGYKFQAVLTTIKFRKIQTLSDLLKNNAKISTVEYDLLFQKSTGNSKSMAFYGFIAAVEILTKKCFNIDEFKEDEKIEYVSKFVDSINIKQKNNVKYILYNSIV